MKSEINIHNQETNESASWISHTYQRRTDFNSTSDTLKEIFLQKTFLVGLFFVLFCFVLFSFVLFSFSKKNFE